MPKGTIRISKAVVEQLFQSHERIADYLAAIRYQTWPIDGLGVGVTAEEMDELLNESDSAAGRAKWHLSRAGKSDDSPDVLDALQGLWNELLRYGPTDDGVEEAMDRAMRAYVGTTGKKISKKGSK